jgi:uncharacterized RDD family membrane protein YckC
MTVEFAGFKRRLTAYCIDFLPILFVVAWVFYTFFGFDEVLARYRVDDPDARASFIATRTTIRNVAVLVYLVYAAAAESSAARGTLGKQLMGIAVVGPGGGRVSWPVAIQRNLLKPLSGAVCGLGYLAILWSPERRAWHDRIADTWVVQTAGPAGHQTEVRADSANLPAGPPARPPADYS